MKFTRNASWMFACRLTGDLLNLLLFIVITRTLGPVGIGAYSYGFAVSSFVFVVGSIGIEEFGLREYSRLPVERRAPFMADLLGAQILMSAIAALGLAVYLLATAAPAATILTVVALATYQVAVGFGTTLFIPAMSEQRMVGPAVIDLLCRGTAMLIMAAAILLWHQPVATASLGFVAGSALLIVLSMRSAIEYGGPVRILISRQAALRIALPLWSFAATELFAQLFSRTGVIVLTLLQGEAAAGVYATGARLIEMALMPLSILGMAAYPRLSQLHGADPGEYRQTAMHLMWLMVVLAGALAWGLYFVSPSLLVPVLGHKYAGTEPVIQVMAAVALVQAVEVVLGRLLLTANRQVARAGVLGAAAVLGLLLNLLIVPRYGVDGAIAASILSFLAVDVTYALLARDSLTGRRVSLALGTLGGGVAIAAALAWGIHAPAAARWVPAAVFFAAFAAVTAVGYRRDRLPSAAAVAP